MCNNQPYGFPSDVWSLGIVLFELLALDVPFRSRDVVVLVSQASGAVEIVNETATVRIPDNIRRGSRSACGMASGRRNTGSHVSKLRKICVTGVQKALQVGFF